MSSYPHVFSVMASLKLMMYSHWFQVILLSKGIYSVCIMSMSDDE